MVADAAGIAEVHVRSWQVGYRGQLPDDLLDSLEPAQRLDRWTTSLARPAWPGEGTMVATEGRVVGFGHLRPSPDEPGVGQITSFYVDPPAWGRGVGRGLMQACLAQLTEAGYGSASLWVLDTNTRAHRFYEAMGWSPDGAVLDDVLEGVPMRDLRYRRDLP